SPSQLRRRRGPTVGVRRYRLTPRSEFTRRARGARCVGGKHSRRNGSLRASGRVRSARRRSRAPVSGRAATGVGFDIDHTIAIDNKLERVAFLRLLETIAGDGGRVAEILNDE